MRTIKLKLSERIVDHLIQAALIFLSVFMAFWLSDYQVRQEKMRVTEKAKAAILKEMKQNLNLLEQIMPLHIELISGKEEVLSNLGTYKSFNISNLPGYNKGTTRSSIPLSKSALSLINESSVNIDIDTRMQINKTYETQIALEHATTKLFDDFLKNSTLNDNDKAAYNYVLFYDLYGDFFGRETALIHSLKESIEVLK